MSTFILNEKKNTYKFRIDNSLLTTIVLQQIVGTLSRYNPKNMPQHPECVKLVTANLVSIGQL